MRKIASPNVLNCVYNNQIKDSLPVVTTRVARGKLGIILRQRFPNEWSSRPGERRLETARARQAFVFDASVLEKNFF